MQGRFHLTMGDISSVDVIIWLMLSQMVQPKVITLSGAYCITHFSNKVPVGAYLRFLVRNISSLLRSYRLNHVGSLSLSVFLFLFLCLPSGSLCLALSLSLSHSHTHTHSNILSYTPTLSLSHFLFEKAPEKKKTFSQFQEISQKCLSKPHYLFANGAKRWMKKLCKHYYSIIE